MSAVQSEGLAWANSREGLKAHKAMEERLAQETPIHYEYHVPDVVRILDWQNPYGTAKPGKPLVFRTKQATVLASSDPRTFGVTGTVFDGRDPDLTILYETPHRRYVKRHYRTYRSWTGSSVRDDLEPLSLEEAMILFEDLGCRAVDWETAFDGTEFEEA